MRRLRLSRLTALLRAIRDDFLSRPYTDERGRSVEMIDEAIEEKGMEQVFAWLPTVTEDAGIVWFRKVWRKWDHSAGGSGDFGSEYGPFGEWRY